MPITRTDFEQIATLPEGQVSRVLRFYSNGISPEWLLEHLVRRELLYLQMPVLPEDPRIPRRVKDGLIRKE